MSEQPVTVEVEYDVQNESQTNQWVRSQLTALEAKNDVVKHEIPITATIHRVGVWRGRPEDRPDNGHEAGLLDGGGL